MKELRLLVILYFVIAIPYSCNNSYRPPDDNMPEVPWVEVHKYIVPLNGYWYVINKNDNWYYAVYPAPLDSVAIGPNDWSMSVREPLELSEGTEVPPPDSIKVSALPLNLQQALGY